MNWFTSLPWWFANFNMTILQVIVFLIPLGCGVQCIETLENDKNQGQQGTPFGKVEGPKSKNDKILIVGAGSAGIHMAYKLQELGFTKVTVFEKSGRIGGKSKTVYHRLTPHEMGTCYTQPDYTEIFNLVDEFDAGEILNIPTFVTVTNVNGVDVPLTPEQYVAKTVAEVKGITDPVNASAYFIGAVAKYIHTHRSLFGVYERELMPRPSQDVLNRINLSFLDFLKSYDMEVIRGIAKPAITTQGYGYLEEVPALYGLMWLTPNFLQKYIAPSPNETPIRSMSKGFQFLWEEIARQRGLNVKLYHDVKYICRKNRQGRNPIRVKYQHMQCGFKEEEFDFVITTPYLKEMIENGQLKPNKKEYNLFSPAAPAYFTVTLMDTTYGNRAPAPRVIFADSSSSDPDGLLSALRDSYATLMNIDGLNYTSGQFPGGHDNQSIQTSLFYQFAKGKQTPRHLTRLLKREMKKKMNMDPIDSVIEQETWTYFPNYSKEKLTSGILWDIYDIQGKYGIWYTGSSVCFESVKSTVEYNLLLLRNYDIPT